jgi:hypothetical protein
LWNSYHIISIYNHKIHNNKSIPKTNIT